MHEIYGMPGHLLRRMHQISVSVFAERMRSLGLDLTSPQYAALAILDVEPGIDQATLAGLIAHDRATIGGVLERLEAKGLLERRQSPNDRRAKVLELTQTGHDLLRRLSPEVRALQEELLPGLSPQERAEFIRLASKVAEAGNETARVPLKPRR